MWISSSLRSTDFMRHFLRLNACCLCTAKREMGRAVNKTRINRRMSQRTRSPTYILSSNAEDTRQCLFAQGAFMHSTSSWGQASWRHRPFEWPNCHLNVAIILTSRLSNKYHNDVQPMGASRYPLRLQSCKSLKKTIYFSQYLNWSKTWSKTEGNLFNKVWPAKQQE